MENTDVKRCSDEESTSDIARYSVRSINNTAYNQCSLLNGRRIHHNANVSAHGVRRQVVSEPRPHWSAVSVRAGHSTPDSPQAVLSLTPGMRDTRFPLTLIHEDAAFSDVIHCVTPRLSTLDAEQCEVLVLVAQSAFISGEHRVRVEFHVTRADRQATLGGGRIFNARHCQLTWS